MGKKFLSKNKNSDKTNSYKKNKFNKRISFSKYQHKNNSKFNKNKNKSFSSKPFFKKKKDNNNHEKNKLKKQKRNENKEKKDNNNIEIIDINENKEEIENDNDNEKNFKKNEIKNNNDDNDNNMKEIFIRNIGYTTSEEKLKELFTQLIPENTIEFCLLCKDKETQNNKGSAFIKLTKDSYNKVMSLYKEYSNKRSNFNEMNPFELEGRYLKLFDAMTREELKDLEKEKEKKNSKRNKTYLYYGLSKETIIKFKEYENISDTDKQKRERLIQIKKDNFYNNPNFHVSETRLSFRNLDKNINENILKEKINEVLCNDEEIKKEYKNIKLIKQIKLLKEDDDKSKCVAFVECYNFNIAKFLIDNLSGITLNVKSNKGLIIDFSLDDFRKRLSREKKLERLKEIKKQLRMEKKAKKINDSKDENNQKEEKKVELKDINDINKLIELYHTTLSRGKKQRIKKKLKSLGYNKDISPVTINNNNNKINRKENNNNKNSNDDYIKIKISNNRTELNKKMKNKIKQNKKDESKNKNNNLIGKKREREKIKFGDDEEKIQKKKEKKEKKALNASKNIINEKMNYLKKGKNNKKKDEGNDEDLDLKDYYSKIEEQLTKKP